MFTILHLTLHREYFDQIAQGIKVVEYRENKPYWFSRLVKSSGIAIIMRDFNEIHFKNGYNKDCPFMRVEYIETDYKNGRFEIKLGKVLEIRNWNGPATKKGL